MGTLTTRHAIAALLLVAAFAAPSAFAQKGTIIRSDIHFTKGSSAAHVAGRAAWGTSYRYFFNARAGQKVMIALAGQPTFSFRLIVPPQADGEQPDGRRQDVRAWAGILNDSGRYEINVSQTTNTNNPTPFTLTLEIH
jgi:hypothetical protein